MSDRLSKIKTIRLKSFTSLSRKAFFVLKTKGIGEFVRYSLKFVVYGRRYFQKRTISKEDYRYWIEHIENRNIEKTAKEIENFHFKPKVSIITPVYNVNPKWLNKCIKSVISQTYSNWELCLYDDASTNKATLRCLEKWEKLDNQKIKIRFGKKNLHISGASNQALKMATGEFITLLDNDDELAPNALFENIKALNKNPQLDLIYSDEDKLDLKGNRIEPFFKPDWSPDLLLSMPYVSHLGFYRKSIIDAISGFQKGFEGSQDYDLLLRFIEKTDAKKILHIPKILYHWRKLDTSTSIGLSSKNYAVNASIRALKDYLQRNAIRGEVLGGLSPGRFRIKRKILKNYKVAIIIPFRDQARVLKKCVESILNKTSYAHYEILLVNNQSEREETKKYLKNIKKNPKIRLLHYQKHFNFSAINNFAARETQADFLLFLNNDTKVINKEWLSAMVEHIQREEVGAVGAKLIFPNETVQHAGVVLGMGVAGHAFKYFPRLSEGYMSQINVIKNYSAVTGACLLTKRDLFLKVGGFDEKNLKVAFNDIDYCLKLREKDFLVVYTPYAELYHFESLSRGDDEELKKKDPKEWQRVVAERKYMFEKWQETIKNDPYYNPNLTKKREDFTLAIKEGEVRYV